MHRITALVSSLALLAGLFGYAPQSVRAVDPVYIGPGDGSGECSTPDYTTDGSADDVQFNSAVTFMEGDIDNILYVCPGTYDIDNWIVVGGPLTIEGVSGAERTILDGTHNSQRIIGFLDAAKVIGLTFQNADTDWEGAAIYAGRALTVRDSIFLNNHSGVEGAAIDFSGDEESIVTDSIFIGNSAVRGGAINDDWSLDLVADSIFSDNSADRGGALYVTRDVYEIHRSEFSENHAIAGYGGAIFADDDLDLIKDSLFLRNSATQGGGAVFVDDDFYDLNDNGTAGLVSNVFEGNQGLDGGAIQIDDEFVGVITRNTFLNNVGDDGGAIDFDGWVDGTISDNKFFGNYGTGDGGAIDADDILSSTVIKQNTFIGNTSEDDGGAMWLDDAVGVGSELAIISANTFRDNHAMGDGGAIHLNWMDSTTMPRAVSRNTFRSNRSGGVGGAISIIGLSSCVPEVTTRDAVRALGKNRFALNQATGSRRTANVGAVPCID
jgi:predicted outer membrane repeat protein